MQNKPKIQTKQTYNKNQNYNTFIDPKEVATMMKNLLNDRRSMLVEEIKIKRKVYK